MASGRRAGWKKEQNKMAARKAAKKETTQSASSDTPTNQDTSLEQSTTLRNSSMALTRVFWALNLIVAVLRAMQMIPLSYHWTVFIAYCLFGLSGLEVFRERSLKGWPRWVAATLVIGATIWFTVVGPLSRAPLKALTYTRPGNYSSGVEIGGIPWNQHFTDLRVVITNVTADDYRNVDILLKPDTWTHRAAIVTNPSECELLAVSNIMDIHVADNGKGGGTSVTATLNGSGLDVYDNVGDITTTFASEGGYRLRCATLPSQYTIQIVFALVDANPLLHPANPLQQSQRTWQGHGILNFVELPTGKAVDSLGASPSTTDFSLAGSYVKGIKPYHISADLKVGGNEVSF